MPRQCIFCGGTPVTKEHIFGAWLSPLFPTPQGKQMFIDSVTYNKGQPTETTRRYPLSIDMQVKQVCPSCNGGWMSKLEEDAMEIILALYKKNNQSITNDEKSILASWATKTAIMLQYMGKPNFIPKRRRKWLSEHHFPPPDTCVWIARYDGDYVATCLSKYLLFRDYPKSTNLPDGQSVFFNIGSLLFVVLSLYIKNVGIRVEFPSSISNHLYQIWPIKTKDFIFPSNGINDTMRAELFNINWGDILTFLFPMKPHKM